MIAVFIISVLLVAWTFAGYPGLAVALARGRSEPAADGSCRDAVTVVIAARNEAARIRHRIDNLLASDYPADRLRVLVVDDGSTDGTGRVVAGFGDERVRLLSLDEPVGKAAALNCAMARVDTPLTVFADSRQTFHALAIRRLVNAFTDPSVGLAAGRLELGDGETTGLYWRIETALRRAESVLGWAHGASGAIYAIRSSLFVPLPRDLLLDDVWTPLHVASTGYRLVFVDDAVASEPAVMGPRAEFRRKIRTLSGNWQLLARAPWLLLPWRNRLFPAWFSHKFLRLLAPWALASAFIASGLAVVSDGATWLQALFWLQSGAYAIAVTSLAAPAFARQVPLATAAGSFLLLNLAAMMSLPAWLGSRRPNRFWRG
jgi:cellulose synthase/poly-beta-1,6-N-acetylglucosamine synthase-like glycosyltransferase